MKSYKTGMNHVFYQLVNVIPKNYSATCSTKSSQICVKVSFSVANLLVDELCVGYSNEA